MATKKALAIIAGVGPGTGTAIAHRFSSQYTLILLSRTTATSTTAATEITSAGGSALGLSVDLTSPSSISSALKQATETYPNLPIAAAIYNVGAKFIRKPFLEVTPEDFKAGYDSGILGAFNFSQAVLPHLLSSAKLYNPDGEPSEAIVHPPSLLFTGATASLKSSPLLTAFAPSKHALRSLSQSLAKEFGGEGVHVGHLVVDGLIDTAATKNWGGQGKDEKIGTGDIAEVFWGLHVQRRSGWTWEVDLRPYGESW